MCYFANTNYNILKVEEETGVKNFTELSSHTTFLSAFADVYSAIITDDHILEDGIWSMAPDMKKESGKAYVGINAKIETLDKVSLFKKHIFDRCVIPVTCFFDWQHHDNSKIKVKFQVKIQGEEISYLGGIYKVIKGQKCFAVVTTQANELMSDIHNTKQRMPLIFNWKMAQEWLSDKDFQKFSFPTYDPELLAENLEPEKTPITLF